MYLYRKRKFQYINSSFPARGNLSYSWNACKLPEYSRWREIADSSQKGHASLHTPPPTPRSHMASYPIAAGSSSQCCGTVTIFYGSGSGSYFWKVMVPVPTFEKLWFRFRFLLLKSYGPGSGSSSISRPKKEIFQKKIGIFLPFYIVSCFERKKFVNFNIFIVKCE